MMLLYLLMVFELYQTSSAFKQDEYRLIHERCDLVSYNHSYFKNVTFNLNLFNRTTRAFNFRANLIKDMGTDVKIVTQLYKFLSNEYRFFPATVPVNLCKELHSPKFGFDDIKTYSNIVECPVKKGLYYLRNFIPDYTKYPPHAPYGRYKAESKFSDNGNFLMEFHWYGKVEEIIRWE